MIDERHAWQAVTAREARADFVFAVRTTGVYCRPDCAARRPKRENVRFFPDGAAARAAGFRACLRCRPDGPSPSRRVAAQVERACRILERERVPLAALAERVGLSRWHLLRVFKAHTGMTPREWASARKLGALSRELRRGARVTEAAMSAGYGAESRAREAGLGISPSAVRAGGDGETIRWVVRESALGPVLIACSERGVVAVRFGEGEAELRAAFPRARLISAETPWVSLVLTAIAAPRGTVEVPLDLRGTVFQQRVWKALRSLRAGETVSYAELARRLGSPSGARAVARACAGNGVAVLVPCHRVVRGDGSLSGYRWGVERKRALLEAERD